MRSTVRAVIHYRRASAWHKQTVSTNTPSELNMAIPLTMVPSI